MMLRFILLSFISFGIQYSGACQTFKFKTIGRDDGLPHSIITAIVQDKQGFMWFGTHDGLARYDGYQFQVFRPDSDNPHAIHDSWIVGLFVDKQGRTWVRFSSGGISVYDPMAERFIHLLNDPLDSTTISSDLTPNHNLVGLKNSIVQTSDGYIWIATQNGLNRIHPTTLKSKRYYGGLELEEGLTGSKVATLYADDENELLWIGTTEGLTRLDLNTQSVRHYTMDNVLTDNFIRYITKDSNGILWLGGRRSGVMRCEMDESQNIVSVKAILNESSIEYWSRDRNVYQLHVAQNGDVWAGLDDGLYKISCDGETVANYLHGDASGIVSIAEDHSGAIWAGGSSTLKGLFRYSYEDDTFTEYNQNQVEANGYSSNSINTLYLGDSNVLWVGTGKGGLLKTNLNNKKFEIYSEKKLRAKVPEEDEIYAAYVDDEGRVLLGSKIALFLFDRNMNLLNKYYHGNSPDEMNWDVPGAFAEIPGTNEVWVGYFEGKISRFNIARGEFSEHYLTHNPVDKASFPGWSLRDILVASDSTTYFAPMSGGLIVQKKGENDFRALHDVVNGLGKLESTSILSLGEDRQGRIWIGTVNLGVFIYHPKNKTINRLQHDQKRNAISHNEVRVIHQASSGLVWIGTRYGINAYDPKTNTTKQYFMEDGLPSNIIHGILEDREGNLWLSTNMGISKFDVKDFTFTNFLKEDGLQDNEFNEGAYFSDHNGWMYFGGTNGLTRFHPDSITTDDTDVDVIFTSLSINQQQISAGESIQSTQVLDKAINYVEELELPFFLNNFTISFSTLDFRIPEKNLFRYRLVGLDKAWNYCPQGDHSITYGYLPSGHYVLQVQASNIDGLWSNDIKSLNINILPPWWKTVWFRTLFIIFCVAVITFLYLLNIKRLTRQRKLLEETVQERTEELMQVNNKLEQQQRNLQLLSEMGQKITSSVELSDVFLQIFKIVSELMDINELMVGTTNLKANSLDIWGVKSTSDLFTHDTISLDAKDRLSVWVTRNDQPIVSNNLHATCRELLEEPNRKYFCDQSPKSGIYLPLRGPRGVVKGVIVALTYESDAYSPKDVTILENLASYVSIAMDNASAYERIKLQSEQLVQVDKVKSDFYTNVSHEFRTPLSLIQGPVQELIKSPALSLENKKLLGIINRNSQLLLSLVEQIMELSRIDGGAMKINPKEGCISEQFRSIGESFRHLALQKSINLEVDLPEGKMVAVYDQDILNKITYNLLNNAIKYTQPGGTVKLTVGFEEDSVSLVVSDNGRGIPQADLIHIFDRFYRGSLPFEHQESGAGIGLALVHQLVDMVGGKIEATSHYAKNYSEDSGTTFSIYLPVSKLEKTGDADTNSSEEIIEAIMGQWVDEPDAIERVNELLKTKVLVVEDNEELRRFIGSKLELRYHVLYAHNGKEALEIAKKEQPHLIISDIMMPVMNGIQFCKALKSDIQVSHIPIILLTAKDAVEDQNEGLRSGANDYIMKPFNLDQLLLKVQNILKSRLKLIEQFRKNIWTGIQDFGDEVSPQDQKFLTQLKTIMEEQIDNPNLDIDFFCNELGVSRTWLYNKMKALLDCSMKDFIRNSRLKHGAKLMVAEGLTISQTAYAVGFNDPKYFAKCFKNEFGIGPKTYVKRQSDQVL